MASGCAARSRSCTVMSTGMRTGRGICCGCAPCSKRPAVLIRAVAVFADGGADLSEGPLAAGADLARGGVIRRGAAGAASGNPELQCSWVKLGPEGAAACLNAGCNDLGGTLMNESISRAAGASFGQEMPPENMETLIRSLGRTPRQRTTLYRDPPADRIAASFGAAPLSDPINTPARKYERPEQHAAAD